MNLHTYLKKNLTRNDPHPAIDHVLRAELHADGRISFYIHAAGKDSDTPDFWVSEDGELSPRGGFPENSVFHDQP